MAGGHFQTLRALFRPWYVKVGSALATAAAGIGIYASVQDQFPDKLPKLQDVVNMSHALILPWWGWLLVLQAVLGFGLYDYVRRNVPVAPSPATGGPISASELDELRKKIGEVEAQADRALIAHATLQNADYAKILKSIAVLEESAGDGGNRLRTVEEETGRVSDKVKFVGLDVLFLLQFATRQATIVALEGLIAEAPKEPDITDLS